MTIEVGMHTGKHRIKLKLESEDVATHAFMTDNYLGFMDLAHELSQLGIDILKVKYEEADKAKIKAEGKRSKTRRNPRRRKLGS